MGVLYRDCVEAAARALRCGEDANWDLARLTYENTFGLGARRDQEGRVPMDTWCADVREVSGRKFSTGTGALYKRIWANRLHRGNDLLDWHTFYAEVRGETQEERDEERAVYRARSAQPETKAQILREMVADDTIPPETRREVFQQLTADPAIVTEASEVGSLTSRAIGDLERRAGLVEQERRERIIESDPVLKRIDQLQSSLDVEQACARFATDLAKMTRRFARDINKALPRTGPAREQPLFWIRRSLAQARASLDALEGYAESGETDLDVFLSQVLGGPSATHHE